MLSSTNPYPRFLEHFPISGPLFQGLLLLLVVSIVLGAFTLLRHRHSPLSLILIVWAPAFIGCILAAVQSQVAETIVTGSGLLSWSRPDRYIGHIRFFLTMGTGASLLLLCTYLLSPGRRSVSTQRKQ